MWGAARARSPSGHEQKPQNTQVLQSDVAAVAVASAQDGPAEVRYPEHPWRRPPPARKGEATGRDEPYRPSPTR
jgi:hypothetical protein